jgi:ribosomal protein S18 acetylase RimI-like enzyme
MPKAFVAIWAMHVRTARSEELPALATLPHALHYQHPASFIHHALGSKECLVAEIDGNVAGYVVWDRGFFARPFLWMLGVAPAYRHHGVASVLIEHVERLNAGHRLHTSTNESNDAMQSVLEGRGFARVGRLDDLDAGDPEVFYAKQL